MKLSEKHIILEHTGHNPLEAVRENEVDSTCYAEGSYDEVVRCSNAHCDFADKVITRTTKTIEKKAHTPAQAVEENRVEASCETDGS